MFLFIMADYRFIIFKSYPYKFLIIIFYPVGTKGKAGVGGEFLTANIRDSQKYLTYRREKMSQNIVEIKNLEKSFKKQPVLKNISLSIPENCVYGLLGPNGAGKSTLLKMITGLMRPDSGQIVFQGHPWSRKDLKKIGGLIETPPIYENLSAWENLKVRALMLGETEDRIREVLKIVDLTDTGKKPSGKFSLGMKQRLGIAMALLGSPDLLILDEPINGLDPEGIREIRECLLKLNREEGKTILISSHILGELSKIATQYGIIKDGRLIRQMTKEDLEEQCRDYLLVEVEHAERAAAVLAENIPDVSFEVFAQGRIHIYDYLDSGQVTTLLVQNGVTVYSCGLHQIDLEQYFLELMDGGAK